MDANLKDGCHLMLNLHGGESGTCLGLLVCHFSFTAHSRDPPECWQALAGCWAGRMYTDPAPAIGWRGRGERSWLLGVGGGVACFCTPVVDVVGVLQYLCSGARDGRLFYTDAIFKNMKIIPQ